MFVLEYLINKTVAFHQGLHFLQEIVYIFKERKIRYFFLMKTRYPSVYTMDYSDNCNKLIALIKICYPSEYTMDYPDNCIKLYGKVH